MYHIHPPAWRGRQQQAQGPRGPGAEIRSSGGGGGGGGGGGFCACLVASLCLYVFYSAFLSQFYFCLPGPIISTSLYSRVFFNDVLRLRFRTTTCSAPSEAARIAGNHAAGEPVCSRCHQRRCTAIQCQYSMLNHSILLALNSCASSLMAPAADRLVARTYGRCDGRCLVACACLVASLCLCVLFCLFVSVLFLSAGANNLNLPA